MHIIIIIQVKAISLSLSRLPILAPICPEADLASTYKSFVHLLV